MNAEEARRVLKNFKSLALELQAVRFAMWKAIDEWQVGKPFPDEHETDVGLKFVHMGRLYEQEREAKGLNNDPGAFERLLIEQAATGGK